MPDQPPPNLALTPRCYLCGCHLLAIERRDEDDSDAVKCGLCRIYLGRAEDLVAGVREY
ncbi:hypothetical protein [Kushneria sinocarnis]|uniref:hypothetical protein n=1 Tax=Kushneria sinocarnis TaxID=595502 RepID=UPI0014766E27|nr:hypothetical protein [Kushneria sinocarnis]